VHVTFGPFTFDGAARELRGGGGPVHLSPKAFELLGMLLRSRPSAVSKTDLHRELWPDTFVSDGSLAVLVAEIRRAIGDSGRRPSFVRTVNRFGYAFVGAELLSDPAPVGRLATTWSLTWKGERTRLKTGENILGRDPEADVCIDAVGVSRRHAMIVVGDVVTLRDLSSKNGTFVDGTRLVAPVALSDSAEIRLGAVAIQFQRSQSALSTQTIGSAQLRGESS
jgi:DNA-binding winged helix-turn-helix (wHTH) protein